jgi:frataxin-like iron-binding protein CyaY
MSNYKEEICELVSKLEKLEKYQQKIKDINKVVRNAKMSDSEIRECLRETYKLKDEEIHELMNPIFSFEKRGFASYHQRSVATKIREAKKRIELLSSKTKKTDKEFEFEGGTIELSFTDDRVRIHYDEIPSQEVRNTLKTYGYKWSPTNEAWQRKLTNEALWATGKICGLEKEMWNERF